MKNFLKYLIIFEFIFLSCYLNVYADNEYIVLLDAVNIRTGPSTNYSRIELGQIGNTYNLKTAEIIEDELKDGSCDAGWFQIDINGNTGYVCSTYVRAYVNGEVDKTEPTTACEAELKEAGFPSSYWTSLCNLKTKYPEWQFKAIDTKLDWATAVDKFTSCGDSLLYNPKSEWLDTSCKYNEGGFVTVNQSGVAYYLDPRNFLTESYIFQFEDNHYNSALESIYPSVAKSIIENASFYKYHIAQNTDLAQAIADGGKETNINPVHLASRMYQELGTSSYLKNLYQGTFNGEIRGEMYDFRGYYNFYNIGVTGSCVTTGMGSTYCGLTKAKALGWNSVYLAVKGGGDFLNSDYVTTGQYTSYLERFNVVPLKPTSMYLHYYMANMQAPSSEALTAYNSYRKNNVLNSPFIFYIPVYNNMNGVIENNSSGVIPEEPKTETPSETIPSENFTPISSIVTSAGYKINDNYILGIALNTNASTVKNNILALGSENTVEIKANNNVLKDDALMRTGSTINIKNTQEEKTYIVVILGDTSGDGVINALDLLQVQKSILGTYTLTDAFKLAGDTSLDGIINALDLLQVQKHILGTYEIK